MQLSFGSVRQWHWISSALSLVGLLMFSVTGITLNHATEITTQPLVTTVEAILPPNLQQVLLNAAESGQTSDIPHPLTSWLNQEHDIQLQRGAKAEWSSDELYVAMASPGVDAWLAVDLEFNEITYEHIDRGWIAYFNDLHKGRDSGTVWRWFIDAFALACVIFCLTGLILLYRQATHRHMTWPFTALGFVAPLILLLVFVH